MDDLRNANRLAEHQPGPGPGADPAAWRAGLVADGPRGTVTATAHGADAAQALHALGRLLELGGDRRSAGLACRDETGGDAPRGLAARLCGEHRELGCPPRAEWVLRFAGQPLVISVGPARQAG